jgi:hypothetical protein
MRLHIDYLKPFNLFCAFLIAAINISGCSFSESSESFSDSTSSIFSSPSSLSGKDKKYQNDIADYTMAYVKSSPSSANYDSFQKGLSDIAADAGITDCCQDPLTLKGIGKGLKKADVEGVAYDTYKKNFAGNDAKKMESIQDGYDSEE